MFWVMGLVHLKGVFEIIYYPFNECVLGGEILRVFLWTHVMQEYILFDLIVK